MTMGWNLHDNDGGDGDIHDEGIKATVTSYDISLPSTPISVSVSNQIERKQHDFYDVMF